jgi:hypothetical protein
LFDRIGYDRDLIGSLGAFPQFVDPQGRISYIQIPLRAPRYSTALPNLATEIVVAEAFTGMAVEVDIYDRLNVSSPSQRLQRSQVHRGADLGYSVLPLGASTAIVSYAVGSDELWGEANAVPLNVVANRGRLSSVLDLAGTQVDVRIAAYSHRIRDIVQETSIDTFVLHIGSRSFAYSRTRKPAAPAYIWEHAALRTAGEVRDEDGMLVYRFDMPSDRNTLIYASVAQRP